jgi:hypothetical protein
VDYKKNSMNTDREKGRIAVKAIVAGERPIKS